LLSTCRSDIVTIRVQTEISEIARGPSGNLASFRVTQEIFLESRGIRGRQKEVLKGSKIVKKVARKPSRFFASDAKHLTIVDNSLFFVQKEILLLETMSDENHGT
jgi:hypothetical protein